jgi:hypothetical protein
MVATQTASKAAPKSALRGEQRVPEHATAAETREPEHAAEHVNERIRTRTRNSQINREDPFYVNMAAIPPDVSVEWKRFTNVGQEDSFYIARMREQGWEPVNPLEHPDWVPVPPGYDKTTIIKDGLMLMERPAHLTKEARAEAQTLADKQIVEAEQRLGKTNKGEMTRDHEGAKPRIIKEVGRMVAIEE